MKGVEIGIHTIDGMYGTRGHVKMTREQSQEVMRQRGMVAAGIIGVVKIIAKCDRHRKRLGVRLNYRNFRH